MEEKGGGGGGGGGHMEWALIRDTPSALLALWVSDLHLTFR